MKILLAQGSSFDAMMSSGTKVKVGGERYGVTFVKPNKEDKKKKMIKNNKMMKYHSNQQNGPHTQHINQLNTLLRGI